MLNSEKSFSDFRCASCALFFNSFDEQKHHYFTYHSRGDYQNVFTPNLYSSYRHLLTSVKKVESVKCSICNISCPSQVTYDFHLNGKRHSKAINKLALNDNEENTKDYGLIFKSKKSVEIHNGGSLVQESQNSDKPNLMCDICQINCLKLEQLQKHLMGAKHQKKMKLNRFVELKSQKDPSVYCDTCDIFMVEESMLKHRSGTKHKRKSTETTNYDPARKKLKSMDIQTTVEYCGFCHVSLKNATEAVCHYQTQKHTLNMLNRKKNYELWCNSCQISFANQHFLDLHLQGYKHYVRINRGNSAPEGKFSERLLKMREKMKSLKMNIRSKKSSYKENHKANESDCIQPIEENITSLENQLILLNEGDTVLTTIVTTDK